MEYVAHTANLHGMNGLPEGRTSLFSTTRPSKRAGEGWKMLHIEHYLRIRDKSYSSSEVAYNLRMFMRPKMDRSTLSLGNLVCVLRKLHEPQGQVDVFNVGKYVIRTTTTSESRVTR
jgi:hypothetical protein